jgi:hypothetical protein
MVEHSAVNRRVASSNLARGATNFTHSFPDVQKLVVGARGNANPGNFFGLAVVAFLAGWFCGFLRLRVSVGVRGDPSTLSKW